MKKYNHLTAVAVLTLGLTLTLFSADRPADVENALRNSSHERFKSQVLKVISAKDGDAQFRAYIVKWKDQEVIVSDPLVKSDHQVGDTITVLVINLPSPAGRPGPRLLNFSIVPQF